MADLRPLLRFGCKSLSLCGSFVEKTAAKNARSVFVLRQRAKSGGSPSAESNTMNLFAHHRCFASSSSSSSTASPPSSSSAAAVPGGGDKNVGVGVDHVVLLQIDEDAPKKLIRKMYERIKGLTVIPGVKSIVVGETFVKREYMKDRRHGYTHYIRVRLNSKLALKKYTKHPIHVSAVKETITPILEEPSALLAVDCDAPEVFAGEEQKPDWKVF